MSEVQEKILYYNPGKSEKTLLLKSVLAVMGIPVVEVLPEQMGQKVGLLAGMALQKDTENKKKIASTGVISEEMMVLCGLDSGRLEQVLALLRSTQTAVPVKAVLTESNCEWSFVKLYEELCAERAAMGRR